MPEIQSLTLEPSPDAAALTLLGLSPEDFEYDGVPKVAVIPELELRLAHRCKWLQEALEAKREGVEAPNYPADVNASLRVSKVRRDRATIAKKTVDVTALFVSCSTDLLNVLGCLDTLVKKHTHGLQRSHLEAKANSLIATCETLLAKLENFKAQFMSKTYTAENVQALHTVAGHIDGRHQEVQARLAKVQQKLSEYEEHESELLALAEDHRMLEEQIADAMYALQQLERV
mmetsp:Transcript_17569/g.49062  ORF Transcript_17569/g.49062 Transcript_17569/m.49062 type:complete len:231 (-) Transcript_17569:1805-2497(-)